MWTFTALAHPLPEPDQGLVQKEGAGQEILAWMAEEAETIKDALGRPASEDAIRRAITEEPTKLVANGWSYEHARTMRWLPHGK